MSNQQTRTNDHSEINHHILWMLVIVILIVFTGIGVFYTTMKNSAASKQMTADSMKAKVAVPTAVPALGTLSLSTTAPQTKVGQNMKVTVVGDSESTDVAGFDILISYDPQMLVVNTVTSLNTNFQISSFTKRKGEISITGTNISGAKGSGVLSARNLVSISFNGVKAGKTNIDIKPMINNERTKFIDMKFQQYMPKLGSLQLAIL